MIERKFVQEGIVNMKIAEFLDKELDRAEYSRCEIKRTPLATRIVIYAGRPALVIGRGGERIAKIQEKMKEEFGIENPQIEVKGVDNPYLDAKVVAKRIKFALERGLHYKRVVTMYLNRIMEAGAVGVEIDVSGKLTGERHRTEKYVAGYVMKCGHPAQEYVDVAKEQAVLKPGVIGVKVEIMPFMPPEMELEKRVARGEVEISEDIIKKFAVKKEEDKEEEEAEKEEEKVEETKEGSDEKNAVKEKAKKAEKKTAEKKGDERKKEVKKKEGMDKGKKSDADASGSVKKNEEKKSGE